MIVGTAGHIDHGKTSLVRALTGVDTDRLKEEKARGITIELGFAYKPARDGTIIGFVDVPGHERLVHTMLAGATGIDFVVLVVACDDGVMPQTREHAAIIDLLGLSRGVVALTKCDLATDDRIADVAGQVRALLANTSLAGAEIVPVSTVTGRGVTDLAARLDAASEIARRRNRDGRFRLAADRVFSLAGAGTVVTGTVLSGQVTVGSTVVISPSGREGRVRSIHAQNTTSDTGSAGERCALAIVGPAIDTTSVTRGDVVLDPTLHHPVARIDVQLRLLASERKPLSQWLPVKFHHAAAERDAKLLVLRDSALQPGETDFAQIVLASPMALTAGDRFILRDASAMRTMGGGVIIDLAPPERRRATPERRAELLQLAGSDVTGALRSQLAGRGFVELDAFFRDRALPPGMMAETIDRLSLVTFETQGHTSAMSPEGWARYVDDATGLLKAHHAANPDQPGLGQERLRLQLTPRLPAAAFGIVLKRLVAGGHAVLDRSWVRRPDHVVRFTAEDELTWSRIRLRIIGADRFRPPRVRDIATAQMIDEAFVRRLFRMAARRGDVDEIAKDHFFAADTVTEMADIARELGEKGEFSVIAFRNRLDNGRKVAIQILEFFDRQGLTMRRGDLRRINPHRRDLYSRSVPLPGGSDREGGETSPVGRPDFKSGEGRETVLGGFDSCLLRQPKDGVPR